MERTLRRILLSGALLTAAFSGCSSPNPLTYEPGPTRGRGDASSVRPSGAPEFPAADGAEADLPVLDERAALADYLRFAALRNPGLEAKFQDWKAALERLPQVRALPDPRFTYGYYLGEVETRAGPMRHSVALAQTFPWFGKLGDREDAAAREAAAAYDRFEAARLDLFHRVESSYNELFFLKRSIDVTSESIELLQQFERIAQTRYRVGAGGHPDLIKIQLELATLEDQLRERRDLRAPLAARLNAALGRPTSSVVPWPTSVASRGADVDDEQLFALLRKNNPELMALQEDIERARVATEIARQDGLPDLTVGLTYTSIGTRGDVDVAENGDDAVLATLSVNLPIWREKYDAGVREAVARRLAAAGRRSERAHELVSELQEALFEHRDAQRRAELYRDTLTPKAMESLEASLGGFAQGESDFLDLLIAQQTLLEFQLALERAVTDRATAYARLERIVGGSLSGVGASTIAPENAP